MTTATLSSELNAIKTLHTQLTNLVQGEAMTETEADALLGGYTQLLGISANEYKSLL